MLNFGKIIKKIWKKNALGGCKRLARGSHYGYRWSRELLEVSQGQRFERGQKDLSTISSRRLIKCN
jgi:hypothetical protein